MLISFILFICFVFLFYDSWVIIKWKQQLQELHDEQNNVIETLERENTYLKEHIRNMDRGDKKWLRI